MIAQDTIERLANFIGATAEEIDKALAVKKDYREVAIPKKNGGERIICIPPEKLVKVQRKIKHTFEKGVQLSRQDTIFGFGRPDLSKTRFSIEDHAYTHRKSRWFLSFDIKNAFDSVSGKMLYQILIWQEFGPWLNPFVIRDEDADLILSLITYKDRLPQGAPTSPLFFFFYLTMKKKSSENGQSLPSFWQNINEAIPCQWKVSLYSDNFVVSGENMIPDDVRGRIFSVFQEFEFQAHKTRQLDIRHGSPNICGLRIHRNRVPWLISGEKVLGWSNWLPDKNKIVWPRGIIKKMRGMLGRYRFNHDPKLKSKIQGMFGAMSGIYPLYGSFPNQIFKVLDKNTSIREEFFPTRGSKRARKRREFQEKKKKELYDSF